METIIDHGDPRDLICQAAEKLHVDMLVMGSHGYGLIKRLVGPSQFPLIMSVPVFLTMTPLLDLILDIF